MPTVVARSGVIPVTIPPGDVVAILTKMHFRYDVGAAEMFDWLRAGGRRSGSRRLDEMAADLERTCILSRPLLPPVVERG